MCPPATDPRRGDPGSGGESDFPEIKGYRILGVLGEGAVGVVYKARRVDTGVSVALKVLHALGPKRRKHIARLVKEGRVIARLNHPGIVKGLDVGESGGCYFIAMELVEGASIRDHLEAGRIFTEEETLDVAVRVVRALHHAARQGVVHRDIKPANLMLTLEGKIKITDLGLAKDAVDLSLTRSDATVGTPQYISPEQARDSQAVDLRSDIFSLGATLYHMVTGRPPFTGSALAEIITKVLYEAEKPLEHLNPAISAPFSRLLSRMLVKNPDDRYQNYLELLSDIERVMAGRDIQGPVRRSSETRLSRGLWLGAAAGLIAVALVVFVWKPWKDREKTQPTPPPVIPTVKPGPTAPTGPPARPRWEVDLEDLRKEMLGLIEEGRFDDIDQRMDRERPGYLEKGIPAKTAYERLRDEIKGRVERKFLRSLGDKLRNLGNFVDGSLGKEIEKGIFEDIHARITTIDGVIRNLPNILEVNFGMEFRRDLDAVEEQVKTKAEAEAKSILRGARELATEWKFRKADSSIVRLKELNTHLFYPKVRVSLEDLEEKLQEMRRGARAEIQKWYQAVNEGFERRMANWEYKLAHQELSAFEGQLKPLEEEAPDEIAEPSRQIGLDRNVYRGAMKIWELAVKSLYALMKDGTSMKLSFEGETSPKVITGIEGKEFPELIKVRFRMGSIENREKVLTALKPEDVIRLAERVETLESRWIGLFYFFTSMKPELHPDRARGLLALAEAAFLEAGGPGPRMGKKIEAWKRELNLNQQEREKRALKLYEDAVALYGQWEFRQAARKLSHMKDYFTRFFKKETRYKFLLTKAEQSIPLEDLKRRFPGAERVHLDGVHSLAFRLRFRFTKDTDLSGLDLAWENWDLETGGLKRVVSESQGEEVFPRLWGIRIPIRLNYKRTAELSITVVTDNATPMSLLCISLGGNCLGLLNQDGLKGIGSFPPNQVSLWLSRSRFRGDVFKEYKDQFFWRLNPDTKPSNMMDRYRLKLGQEHRLKLMAKDKERSLSFHADGVQRHKIQVRRVKALPEIEIRPWNKPIVVKEIVIEGILSSR